MGGEEGRLEVRLIWMADIGDVESNPPPPRHKPSTRRDV
jgi:hypothetical protein